MGVGSITLTVFGCTLLLIALLVWLVLQWARLNAAAMSATASDRPARFACKSCRIKLHCDLDQKCPGHGYTLNFKPPAPTAPPPGPGFDGVQPTVPWPRSPCQPSAGEPAWCMFCDNGPCCYAPWQREVMRAVSCQSA